MKKPKIITIDRVVSTSFLVDLSDVIISLIGVIFTGSVTMISQALEGLSDVFSSGFLMIGNKRAKLPSDSTHPYGYGGETFFWALMSGLVTFSITATISIYLGWKRFTHPETINNLPFAFIALISSVLSNGYSSLVSYKKLKGIGKDKKILDVFMNSPLIEVKTSMVLDTMGTVAAVFGIFALTIYHYTGDLRFDGVGAILTGLSLAFFSYFILIGAKDLLIGKAAPKQTREEILTAVESFDEVSEIIDLRTLVMGTRKMLVNIEINVVDNLSTDELEILIDKIESSIKDSVKMTPFIQIELEMSNKATS